MSTLHSERGLLGRPDHLLRSGRSLIPVEHNLALDTARARGSLGDRRPMNTSADGAAGSIVALKGGSAEGFAPVAGPKD